MTTPMNVSPTLLARSEYIFHVTTMQRTYNSVTDKEHFAKVRKNWGDYSEILDVWKWDSIAGKYVNVTDLATKESW